MINEIKVKLWKKGYPVIIEAYHGSPYNFNTFISQFEEGGRRLSQYYSSGFFFTSSPQNAKPFADQYPLEYTEEIRQIEKRRKEEMEIVNGEVKNIDLSDVEDEILKINKNAFRYMFSGADYNDLYLYFRIFGKEYFSLLSTESRQKIENILNMFGDKIFDLNKKYDQEIKKIEEKYANQTGNVMKVLLRGKRLIIENGEDLGVGGGRESVIDNLDKDDILLIKDADTGYYIGDEIVVSNPDNIYYQGIEGKSD